MSGVILEAASVSVAHHGLQTLLQIVAQAPIGKLPCLKIDDWPDFQDRGVYYDLARGRVPTLGRLAQQVELLSQYKINQFQLYIEHTFHFRSHPEIGKGCSPLTAEDVMRLDAYCLECGVELVPSLATFGHMSRGLCIPSYRHMAEDWGVGRFLHPDWQNQQGKPAPWTISPANPDTYKFLDSLFAEFLPCFSSQRFNLCCDETWDLGAGQTYKLCEKKGKGRVYLDHVLKLRKLAAKYGKTVMFWGDIIRHYPELISDIPTDVIALDWGYGHLHDFAAIRDFRKAGRQFYACPGTNSWNAMFPRWPESVVNIHEFAEASKRNNGLGVLNTDWGDGGHYNFMEYCWPGYLFGAEQSWNVKADIASFPKRFCKLFLGCSDADLVRAFKKLGDIAFVCDGGNSSVWPGVFFALPADGVFAQKSRDGWVGRAGAVRDAKIKLDAAFGKKVIKELQVVRQVLAAYAARRGMDPTGILPYWVFAADTITHAARKLTVFGTGGRNGMASRKRLRQEMTALMKRFEKLWMARNRRSEIGITLKRYRKAIGALR